MPRTTKVQVVCLRSMVIHLNGVFCDDTMKQVTMLIYAMKTECDGNGANLSTRWFFAMFFTTYVFETMFSPETINCKFKAAPLAFLPSLFTCKFELSNTLKSFCGPNNSSPCCSYFIFINVHRSEYINLPYYSPCKSYWRVSLSYLSSQREPFFQEMACVTIFGLSLHSHYRPVTPCTLKFHAHSTLNFMIS